MGIQSSQKEKAMRDKALDIHKGGKLAISSRVKLDDAKDLSLAYTPGVAIPCQEIYQNPDLVYKYTSKGHMVLVVSDGSAVLGLGNIGAKAAIPVMEGKALLLKRFAGLDAFPICLETQDPEEIIKTIKLISCNFGGIILEDIASPNCVLIERKLQEQLQIPVFHDDQHGTAIVVAAALINATRLLNKNIEGLKIVVSGTGAAGSAVIRILKALGVNIIYAYNKQGVVDINNYHEYNFVVRELLDKGLINTPKQHNNTLSSIIAGCDAFIGLSGPNILLGSDVKLMNDPIIFALANPQPEIMPEVAKANGAKVIGTGRSDYPNQINNVLAFPGIFKGALKAKIPNITLEMKIAAAKAISNIIEYHELSPEYIIPSVFDERVVEAVSDAIMKLG
jgi:malate dehydrogenase (oxaloacetate-decarboxylating)